MDRQSTLESFVSFLWTLVIIAIVTWTTAAWLPEPLAHIRAIVDQLP